MSRYLGVYCLIIDTIAYEKGLETYDIPSVMQQLITLLLIPGLCLFVSETNTQTREHVYSDLLQVLAHLSCKGGTFCSGAAEHGKL